MTPTLVGNSLPGQDLHGSATAVLTIPPSSPFVIPVTLPNATPGVSYSQTLTAAGGQSPYTWSINAGAAGPLPGGLSINASTGVISGTPTGAVYGRNNFVVQVVDFLGSTNTLLLNIFVQWAGTALSITTVTLPTAAVGTSYSQPVSATGGQSPYIWSVFGALPPGLAIAVGSGVISGTPTLFGVYAFTIQVTDATTINVVSQQFSIAVQPILAVDTKALKAASIGVPYLDTLSASGGTPTYNWRIISGTLHPGLALDPSTGIISGTPTSLSLGSITFGVIDSA